MLQLIISIFLLVSAIVLFMAYLQKRTAESAQRFRRVAIGTPAILIPLLGTLAVGPERILLGLGAAVFVRESFYLLNLDRKSVRLNGIVDFLPVAITIAFFFPYSSYISLFFGFDLGILIFSGVIAMCYLFLKGRDPKQHELLLNSTLLIASISMLGWFAIILL